MKHSLYIFLGTDLGSTAKGVMRHILKHGTEDVRQHFRALEWLETDEGVVINSLEHQPADESKFYPSEDYLYQVGEEPLTTLTNDRRDEQIKAFFRDWHDNHVVVGTEGASENLLVSIVFPSADEKLKEQAAHIVSIIDNETARYDIELLLPAPDLYKVFAEDESFLQELDKSLDSYHQSAKKQVTELLSLRKQSQSKLQIVLFQNRNKHGASLNLDFETFTRMIGEYAMACIENYRQLYNPNLVLQDDNDDKIVGIGVSCLSMDRYYFQHYLLHHAYLWMMEREKVAQRDVDINKASSMATDVLKGRQNIMTDFYNRYVQPELDKGKSAEDIIPSLRPEFDTFMSELENVITGYIDKPDMSLPEKFAVLAQVLVMDEDSLSGNLYDKEQPTFIDLFREPVDYFLNYNNNMLVFKKDENGDVVNDPDTDIPIIESGIITIPQGQDGKVFLPTDEIKRLRIEIRQASEYIRQKTEQLNQLDTTRQQNRMTEEVIVGDDFRKFKLIDEGITEDPFDEDYAPKPTQEANIDLSHEFTPVKNQGGVGSCTTFAVSSVFEYIMKKNDRTDYDLSERFIYYNVREERNRLDSEGSAITDVIRSVHAKGICTEEMCPYSETDYNIRPTEEAYRDAELRKIKTAMNVRLGNDIEKNRDLLRSAIAEGYPVIIALRLFEPFFHLQGNNGLVPMPTDDDLANDSRDLHAMVICGYDDANELFLVRNSWGETFGRKGYCYVPYAYMCDADLCHYACIITEVNDNTIQVNGVKGRHRVSLDTADLNIRMTIISNMIASKRKVQSRLAGIYNKVYTQYEQLLQTLEDPSVRERITDEAALQYGAQAEELRRRRNRIISTKGERLSEFDALTTQTKGRMLLSGGALVLIYALFTYVRFNWSWVSMLIDMEAFMKATYYAVGAIACAVLTFIVYHQQRLSKRRKLEQLLDEEIQSLSRRLGEVEKQHARLKIRSFVAGMVIDGLANLSTNLYALRNSMRSYINNLAVWYEEENASINDMRPDEHVPFLTVLDNATLDAYFEQHKEELTRNIRLYECLHGEYEIDDEKIFNFKNKLKQKVLVQLAAAVRDFNIYDHVAGLQRYDFLKAQSQGDLNHLVQQLDNYSEPFLQEFNSLPTQKNFFVRNITQENSQEWESLCRRNSSGSLSFGQTGNPFRIQEIQIEYMPIDNITMFS